jgi:ankyrin repeat protein
VRGGAVALLCLVGCSSRPAARDAGAPRVDAPPPLVRPADAGRPAVDSDDARLTLHQAAARCATERIAELLENGSGAEVRDREGRTPLHVAAGRCTAAVVKRLVDAGADVRAVDNDGMTPLHQAAAPARSGSGPYAIWTAGDLEVVRFLIAMGADPRAATPTGWTPLHATAQIPQGGTAVTRALLDAGAAIDARDAHGWTPLHVAARFDAADVARLLRDRGAALAARTTAELRVLSTVYAAGSTPLDVARAARSKRVLAALER